MKKFKNFLLIALVVLVSILPLVLRVTVLYAPFNSSYETWLSFVGRQAVKVGFYSVIPWSMKPPGESLTYGTLYLLAGVENWLLAVRVYSLVVCSLTTFLIFLLGKTLFSNVVGIFAALFWAVFSGAVFGGQPAYAEMFMPLFTVLCFYLFFNFRQKKKEAGFFILAGIPLGISLLYKQIAIYDFLSIFILGIGEILHSLICFHGNKTGKTKKIFLSYFFLALGFSLPMIIFIIYIIFIGKFAAFWEWVVIKPLSYGKIPGAPQSYLVSMWRGASFLWIFAALGILLSFFKPKKEKIFLDLWILAGVGTLISANKFWGYYFLQLLSPLSILASVFIFQIINLGKGIIPKIFYLIKFVIVMVIIVCFIFKLCWSYYEYPLRSYLNYRKGLISREEFSLMFSDRVWYKNRLKVAEYLKKNMIKGERVFVWDGDTGIYVFADIFPPYQNLIFSQQFWFSSEGSISFTYFSSSQTIEGNRRELINNLTTNPPNYIVLSIDSPVIVFSLLKEFNQFFSFVFQNYSLVNNCDDIWVYQLRQKQTVIPKEQVVDFEFVNRYFLVEPVSTKRVVIRPIAGEFSEIEASLAEGNVIKESSKIPVEIIFFGLDGKDFVGAATYGPSGETDLHLQLKKEKAVRIKTISIIRNNILWVYPPNGANLVIEAVEEENKIDLYFSRSDSLIKLNEGDYELSIFYIDGSISKLKIPAKDIQVVAN